MWTAISELPPPTEFTDEDRAALREVLNSSAWVEDGRRLVWTLAVAMPFVIALMSWALSVSTFLGVVLGIGFYVTVVKWLVFGRTEHR